MPLLPVHPVVISSIQSTGQQYLSLPEDTTTVMVSELRCGETDCPDIETVVAILTAAQTSQKITINKSIAELSEADIKRTLDTYL